jgi:hypothetical protein
MEGRNSFGRRISLLNEGVCASAAESAGSVYARLPSLAFRHSRNSSFASSAPNSSPPTPKLVRSDSSDSSAMNQTPSPLTPSFDFSGLQQHSKAQDAIFTQQQPFFSPPRDQQLSHYPPIPQQHAAGPFSYPAQAAIAPQPQLFHTNPPASDSDSRSLAAGKAPKKNQYPCPLSKQFNCHDFFTTSGHAARHAKKHTGKKDAFCPECNKAFTRKDNMEQHRRTHQNGRNSKSAGESQPKRAKTSSSTKRSSKPPPLQASTMPALDPSLPQSPASSFGYPEPNFAQPGQNAVQPYPLDLLQQSPFVQNTPYHMTGPYDPALPMNGLDTLAIAAAKRDADF